MKGVRSWLVCGMILVGNHPCPAGSAVTNELKLKEFLQRVAERNESVQMRVLEAEAARHTLKAEQGAFEPEVFGGATHEELNRQNTVQEERSQLGFPTFDEQNNIYEGGIEGLVPSGARIRLGYTLRDLNNNLQTGAFIPTGATNGEYQSFIGVNVTQPLLKNAGLNSSMARIRMAALTSMIAFQEYRKQNMLVLSTAESTYWQLYLLQEQLRFLEQSVKTAATVLNDSQVRLSAGRGSELDVLDARAGLAMRESLLGETRQKLRETSNNMASLTSERLGAWGALFYALTAPRIQAETPRLHEVYSAAFELNPDYLMQIERAERDGVAFKYARNQRLPELNLKGAYGYSGLSDTPGGAWDEITTTDWPAWNVGVELRLPLTGGQRGRNEVEAARLREQQSLLGLRAMETQLLNSLDTALQRIDQSRLNASNYEAQVVLNERVLEAALARLEVGQIESRKVLEIEAQLLESQSAAVEALIDHRQAVVELDFLQGRLLQRHDLDFSQQELALASAGFVQRGGLSRDRYSEFVRTTQRVQAAGGSGPWPGETDRMRAMRSEVREKALLLDGTDGFVNPEALANERLIPSDE